MRNNSNSKLVFVGFAFSHHTKTHSGYHQIRNHVKYDKIINAQFDFNFVFNIIERLPQFIKRRYRNRFGYRLWFTELRCILRAIFFRNQIFHIIYGENILRHLGKYKGKTNTIIATYHQPVSQFKNNPDWALAIKYLDGIILMGDEDPSYFKKINPAVRIAFIPHGVDTNFFKPGELVKTQEILMVGNWLRDFDFANEVFKKLSLLEEGLNITVVTNKNNFRYFEGNVNITLKTGIPNDELRSLYQTSRLVFLPLIEFTANNALLEAASCNCDIVVCTDRINYSYFDKDHIIFLNLEIELVVNWIYNRLKSTSSSKKNLRDAVIRNFSWPAIGDRTYRFLKEKNR